MNSINYMKLDIRLTLGTLKYYAFIPLIVILMFMQGSPIMAIGYMFFFLVIFAATPFSAESNQKCEGMYFILPSNVESMVLGRYLYFAVNTFLIWAADGIIMLYAYNSNVLGIFEIAAICTSGLLATIICFMQFPIYYKFGMERGRILSLFTYLIPALGIFALPSSLKDSSFIKTGLLKMNQSSAATIIALSLIIVSIIGIISYLISCTICKRKEL